MLETPVEMWFGESRVGVKPGSATYERFRKFADVLAHGPQRIANASR